MATKRITTAKKELSMLLQDVEEWQPIGCDRQVSMGAFSCTFADNISRKELERRANAVDRSCYHEKRINGGLKVQSAMVFIMANRDIAANVKISYHSGYSGCIYYGKDGSGYYAYNGKKRLEKVDFTPSDYNYAMQVMRIK